MKNKIFLFFLLLFLFHQFSYSQFSGTKLQELQGKLDSTIAPLVSAGVTVSAKVIHADNNKVMFEYQPEIKVIPASITKIVTSACALSKLGQSYNIPTIVYTDDNNIGDGIVNGNIYLKGYGDPDLNNTDIDQLAQLIIKSNIKEITGNIVADESYFDDNYKGLSGYYKGDTGPSYWPYVNALPLNKNEGISNPAMYAASLLSESLSMAGVIVGGTVINGVTPKAAKELAQISHSIFDVLSYMNKESNNHSAITMFKLLGAKFKNNPGNLEEGQEVIESFLSEIGVDRYSYEILEGSGLTRYNKVNADMYMKILKYMYDDQFLFDYFFNSLAVAGKDGTLRNRMIGTEAEGNIHAKTGTLNGVSALSGYVVDRDNEILIFFIVMNGSGASNNTMHIVQDQFCIQLAEFSRM